MPEQYQMSDNPLKLKRIDHVEFYTGNAKQAAYYYRQAFGFSQFAYSGLETGMRDASSYALRQGKADFVFTSPLSIDHPSTEHVRRHGDGVHDIAFEVDDVQSAFEYTVSRGAVPAMQPVTIEDAHGRVRRAAIHTYGDTIHSFISRRDYAGAFLPGYESTNVPGNDTGILRVDHIVGNVELGRMDEWANFYHHVLGFDRYITFDDKDISTDYSALMSIVMSDQSHSIMFPINEPAPGRRKSQIQEYIEAYNGPGAQHIALATGDAIETVSRLRRQGVEFLRVPDEYYEMLPARVGRIDEPVDVIKDLGILVDRDEEGYLLQIFTKPVEDRPTLFYEIIQRKGCRGFGKGNFKALFVSIEEEQAKRGNL
jgi:4-hydroxyphenylpyruvate dioxygenase